MSEIPYLLRKMGKGLSQYALTQSELMYTVVFYRDIHP